MRKLLKKEEHLLQLLIDKSNYSFDFTDLIVRNLKGGNGSVLFLNKKNTEDRSMSKTISEMNFKDKDKTIISVSLSIDNDNNLYELDIWKTDFSEIIKYPSLSTLI